MNAWPNCVRIKNARAHSADPRTSAPSTNYESTIKALKKMKIFFLFLTTFASMNIPKMIFKFDGRNIRVW